MMSIEGRSIAVVLRTKKELVFDYDTVEEMAEALRTWSINSGAALRLGGGFPHPPRIVV